MNWKMAMLSDTLDMLVDWASLDWVIEALLDYGYTKEQLEEVLFDPDDIKRVMKEMEERND